MVVEQEVAAAAQNRSVATDSAARLGEVEPMVRAICRGRLGEVDGDDAAQRALLTIWRKLESERGVDCLPSYAATCARYETLNAYREFQRSASPAGDLSEARWADTSPGPAEHAERVDEVAHARERVEALLAQLSPRQAEVMRASVLADRPTAELAEELGITPTGVRAAQVRAMARMRELSGARSPNPLASNLTSEERGKRAWEAEKARNAARHAALPDPLDEAWVAVGALHDGRGTTAPAAVEDGIDPLDRARAAVDALLASMADTGEPLALHQPVVVDLDAVDLVDASTDAAGAA